MKARKIGMCLCAGWAMCGLANVQLLHACLIRFGRFSVMSEADEDKHKTSTGKSLLISKNWKKHTLVLNNRRWKKSQDLNELALLEWPRSAYDRFVMLNMTYKIKIIANNKLLCTFFSFSTFAIVLFNWTQNSQKTLVQVSSVQVRKELFWIMKKLQDHVDASTCTWVVKRKGSHLSFLWFNYLTSPIQLIRNKR